MPSSVYSEDACTPRAPNFDAPSKRLPHLNYPPTNTLRTSRHSTASADRPSMSDPVEVAAMFQPFEGCDLVLRSTKTRPHIEFFVDRETIYARSSYLKQKLSELGPIPDGIEVISWEDDAHTLDAMLRFIYSERPKPEVQDVDHLRSLLKAARRYDIEAARHALGTAVLLDFAKREPLRAFAIACEFGLVDEAALISKDTLEVDIMMSDHHSELRRVSLSYYHRLVRLHKRRATQAVDILRLIDLEDPMNEFDPPSCKGCGTNATWWQIFVDYGTAELKHRPVTTTVFSPSFLAKCVRTSGQVCEYCIESYIDTYSQKLLVQLKEDIDALPTYIASVDPYLYI